MRASIVAAAAALMACATAPVEAQQSQPANTLPDWWNAHVAFVSRDGGTWISPNPPGENDPSQPDAFAMEWRAAYGGHVLIGRLYGVKNGAEGTEYWTFREFWHPGEQRAVIEQWGGPGLYGAGTSSWEGEQGVVEQTFWLPDGRSWREGHRNREMGDEYETHAFDIDADGNWLSKDPRVWTRVRD